MVDDQGFHVFNNSDQGITVNSTDGIHMKWLIRHTQSNDISHKLVIRYVPQNLTKVWLKFLQLSNSILNYKVTGKRLNRTQKFASFSNRNV